MSHVQSGTAPAAPAAPGSPATGTAEGQQGADPDTGAEPPSGGSPGSTPVADVVPPAIRVVPPQLNVPEGASGTYTVVLGSQPTGAVTVTVSAGSVELSVSSEELVFSAAGWQAAQTVTVTAAADDDGRADAPVQVTHTATGGGYDGVAAAAVRVTIVEDDVATLAVAAARAAEQSGRLHFEVTLSLAGDRVVTAHYRTGAPGDTASAGQDYTGVSRTLSFAAGSRAPHTIEVVVLDDRMDEPDEEVTLTLSNANTPLAGGEATLAVTGMIEDDDEPSELSMADASHKEGTADGSMRFAVRLEPASGRLVTVQYETADGSAVAGQDYTSASGVLMFSAGATAQTIAVPILDDEEVEQEEDFTVTLSGVQGARLRVASATGTIESDDLLPLELVSLQVTGGGTMYPVFDPGTHHYALTCSNTTTLQVTAEANRDGAQLTLLRADAADNHVATGTVAVAIDVSKNHDIALEVSDTDGAATYVVNCLPAKFPEITILTQTDGASGGLLLVTPRMSGEKSYLAVLDYNGVPRFHRHLQFAESGGGRHGGQDFRRHPDGRFSFTETVREVRNTVHLLDAQFNAVETVGVVDPLEWTNAHEFLIAPNGNYLFIAYERAVHDLCEIDGYCDPGETERLGTVIDSVIQEVTPGGDPVLYWSSWDRVKVADCIDTRTVHDGDYVHLNSLHLVDGDIVASLRNCHQVLRIDRSSGAVVWQVGGTHPPRNAATEYLEIVADVDGQNEFCKQHSATITASGKLLLFDNGFGCRGSRKDEAIFTRIVEYDISGTQAVFSRQYRLPVEHGRIHSRGAVRELENGNWLAAWGEYDHSTLAGNRRVTVGEVDPATDPPTVVFALNMARRGRSTETLTYRAYREREADIDVPLNLP